jgi:hypothetical protein
MSTGFSTLPDLSRFVGGEAEITNTFESYAYRGRIETIEIVGDALKIKFEWLAKNQGGISEHGIPKSADWDAETDLNYGISLGFGGLNDIGKNRLSYKSWITHEQLILFPEGGSVMNPEHVHGLDPAIAEQQRERWLAYDASR